MFVFFGSIILFPRTYPEEIEIHLINYKNIYWKLLIIAKYWEILKFFPIKENLNKAWYTLGMKDCIAIKTHATKTYLEKCPLHMLNEKNETYNSHSHIQQLFIECLLYARHCSRYWEHSLPSWSLSTMIRTFLYILIFPCACVLSHFSRVYL